MAAKQKTTARRSVRVIEDSRRYVVRVGEDARFFVRFDGSDGVPRVTQAPSAAWHGSYAEADEICVRIREKDARYIAAVADIYGRTIDYQALETEREAQRAREARFWGE
jgi:hypothetical protein